MAIKLKSSFSTKAVLNEFKAVVPNKLTSIKNIFKEYPLILNLYDSHVSSSRSKITCFLALLIRAGYDSDRAELVDTTIGRGPVVEPFSRSKSDEYNDYKYIANTIKHSINDMQEDRSMSEIELFLSEKLGIKKPVVDKLIVLWITTDDTNHETRLFKTFGGFERFIFQVAPYMFPYTDPAMIVADLNTVGEFERGDKKMMIRAAAATE
jgi:hypothetical protein